MLGTVGGNSIGWVQAQLQGGWKRVWILGAAYVIAGGVLLMLVYRMANVGKPNGLTVTRFAGGAVTAITFIQAMMLSLMPSSNILRAVRRDFTSEMIDSHRLTPTPGWMAVFGYLTGPNIQLVPLFVANLLLVAVVSIMGGWSVPAFIAATGMLALYGLAISSVVLLFALCTKASNNMVALIVILSIVAMTSLPLVLPGIYTLLGYEAVMTALNKSGFTQPTITSDLLLAMGGQLMVSAILLVAASRKYLREDVPAFPWPLGVIAMALFTCYNFIGVNHRFESAQRLLQGGVPAFGVRDDFAPIPMLWIAGITAMAMLSIMPVAASSIHHATWLRRARIDPTLTQRRPLHFSVVLILVTAVGVLIHLLALNPEVIGFILVDHPGISPTRAVFLTFVFFVLALMPIGGLCRMACDRRIRALWFVLPWLAAAWIAPIIADVFRSIYFSDPMIHLDAASAEEAGEQVLSALSGASPIGAWTLLILEPKVSLIPGLIAHVILALGLGFILPGRWNAAGGGPSKPTPPPPVSA
jgi:hypothetical protein